MVRKADVAAMERVLAALERKASPTARIVVPRRSPGRAVKKLAVLPGAFNPPTLAHLALARAVREQGSDAVLLALGTRTVDKEEEDGLPPAERAALLSIITAGEPGLGVVLLNRGLYVEQAEALHRAMPELEDLAFVVGMDKLPQIFDAQYYDELEPALDALFARARLIVAARSGMERRALEELVAEAPARRFADRIHWLDLDPRWRPVSSSDVRQRLEHGEPVDDLVPAQVLDHLRRGGPSGNVRPRRG